MCCALSKPKCIHVISIARACTYIAEKPSSYVGIGGESKKEYTFYSFPRSSRKTILYFLLQTKQNERELKTRNADCVFACDCICVVVMNESRICFLVFQALFGSI